MKTFNATQDWASEHNLKFWSAEQTSSTNDTAKSDLSYDLYITDKQTAGRGRNTNQWNNAEPGSSLLSTWRLELDKAPQHLTGPLIGLAVIKSLSETWENDSWSLKAPNDIYLYQSKVAGILCETISVEAKFHLLVGLGINASDHPQEIPIAGNLTEELESEIEETQWQNFLTNLRHRLERMKDKISQSELSEDHRHEILYFLNKHPNANNSYKDFDAQGNLHLNDGQKISWLEI